MGDYELRDLNDEINKLLREKRHWENQIVALGGANYRRNVAMLDDDGKEVLGRKDISKMHFNLKELVLITRLDILGVLKIFRVYENSFSPKRRKRRTRALRIITDSRKKKASCPYSCSGCVSLTHLS